MIKSISSNSPFIHVNGDDPHPYISSNAVSAGMLRYNPNTQNIEVYDGISWHALFRGHVSISLSTEADDLLRWVREHKKNVEQEEKLRNDHPAVKNAWEQYQTIKILRTGE